MSKEHDAAYTFHKAGQLAAKCGFTISVKEKFTVLVDNEIIFQCDDVNDMYGFAQGYAMAKSDNIEMSF